MFSLDKKISDCMQAMGDGSATDPLHSKAEEEWIR